jgi:hypothetical protein
MIRQELGQRDTDGIATECTGECQKRQSGASVENDGLEKEPRGGREK